MKELSIEQKATAYEDLLKKAKQYYDTENDVIVLHFLEELFPELCESEDERIKQKIIKLIKKSNEVGGYALHKWEADEMLAWLERQRQEPKKVSIWKHWKDGICGNGEGKLIYLIKNGVDYSLSSSLGYECDYILLSDLDNLMLEKQGTSYTKKDVDDAYVEGMALAKNELEKQSEQKVSYTTLVKTGNGGINALVTKELPINGCEDTKKQGEQKSDTNCLLSWSEIDEKRFQSLEGIVKDHWAKAEQEKNEIKIREASNVSYFLKTIQKSPLCWIKCSDGLPNKDGTYLVVTDGKHNDVYDLARYDSIDGWHKASEILYWMPIPQLNNKSIIEHKSADWSEEDEKMISRIRSVIEKYAFSQSAVDVNGDLCEKIYIDMDNWLKSLKQRIGWKPSDEQIEALGVATDICSIPEKHYDELNKLYQDLKKLTE